MIRVRLLNEGRTVKQISSRVSESVVLEQIQRYQKPYDEIVIVEGELSEGAKEILQRVAKKVIPAAMAAGMALGGATGAQAQNALPGTERSIGQHISDIFSPNYREIMRQRRAEQDAERRAWDAKQREIARAKIARAREEGRREAQGISGTDMPSNVKVYDQARKSGDGRSYVLYDMQHNVIRIPVAGTEFVPADSQRLAHYLTARGGVYYVRQAAAEHQAEGITEDPTVGTIPAAGGTSGSTIKPTGTRAPGGAPNQDNKEEETDAQAIDLDKDHGLDKASIDAIKKAGVAVNIKEYKKDRLKNMLMNSHVNEGSDRYADQLAQKVHDIRDDLDTSGSATEFIDVAYDIAVKDLGRQKAQRMFAYDEDFVGDLIGAYAAMSQSKGAVKEGYLEEIDRRGFLKGLGAAAVAGAAGYKMGQPDTSKYKNPKIVFLIGYLHAAKEYMPQDDDTLEINTIIEDYLDSTNGNATGLYSGSGRFFSDVGRYNEQNNIGRPGYTEVFPDDVKQKKWITSQGKIALRQLKTLLQQSNESESVEQGVAEGFMDTLKGAAKEFTRDSLQKKIKQAWENTFWPKHIEPALNRIQIDGQPFRRMVLGEPRVIENDRSKNAILKQYTVNIVFPIDPQQWAGDEIKYLEAQLRDIEDGDWNPKVHGLGLVSFDQPMKSFQYTKGPVPDLVIPVRITSLDINRSLVGEQGVAEGFTDSKMQAILDQYEDSWRAFKAGGEIDDNPEFYDALFDYFMDSGEMPYEVAKARTGDPIEWMTNKMDALAGNEKVSEANDDDQEASAADQAAADKNIIMQLRKAADYEKPTQISLDDGSRAEIDSAMAQKILRMFDQLRPDSKALMQQVLGTRKGFDELTKELSQARESVREAVEQYTSLNDAYPAGETEIWYWLDDNARDYMMGYDFLKKQGIEVTADTIPTTHALIGKIRETNPEKIFSMMQGDSWSPEGQANDMISKSGTGHTSMSVGDVIRVGNKWLMVDRFGFRDIASGAKESVEVSETHLDPRRAAMLMADRIMGEVFDK